MTDGTVQLSVVDAQALAELGTIRSEEDLAQSFQRLTTLAANLLPDTRAVSVTVRHEGATFTFVASDALARDLDDQQYDAGAGPCTDALALGETVQSPDLAREARWPDWTPVAVVAGIASMRSAPLVNTDSRYRGALNCYGSAAYGYTQARAAHLSELLGAHANALLANLSALEAAQALADQMTEAMASRALIEQAKGALMSRLGVTADTSFDYLVKLSQNSHRKLRDVARTVTEQASQGPGSDGGARVSGR